jgi:hypothetical protein
MTEQNLTPEIATDDTQGHARRKDDEDTDDTQGHARRKDDEDTDDTQGHARRP